jgi:choline dehydrogenase-like flavoprotein
VIASALQAAGLSVVVLERGGYRNEADFRQLEDVGARDLFLRGGMFFSSDGSLGLLAGATLGGGTVVNSMVCLEPPQDVRELWAAAGLEGLDGSEFDGHLASVSQRIGVNTGLTRQNRTSALLAAGIERFGLTWQTIARNAGQGDDPRHCGYCHNGCQHGCKQSTLKTYLQDAADEGARFVVECDVRRVLTRDGHAAGVEATVTRADGTRSGLTVEADTVVVAAGGLESPALLLRSGLGGPAVGHHLRVHPTYFVGGIYDEPVRGWEGQVQSVVSLDRTRAVDGDGYLVECTTLSPGMWAVISPWLGGEDHKRRMLELPHTAPWHAVCHDHGSGAVRIDADGEPVVDWSLVDTVDRRLASLGHVELAEMHRLAGARAVVTAHRGGPCWRSGDDFDAFLADIGAHRSDTRAFSAHQMGSCRMGADPESSVADGRGELHDTKGVWVGDASAFPTAPGVNPMLTVMALARRTATHIVGDGT